MFRTLRYFEQLQKENQNIMIIRYNHPINYTDINNFGIKHTNGAIIGLINNDVKIITEGWLTEMVPHALRQEIGVVCDKLYYDDLIVQHAGIILGIKGVVGHSNKFFLRNSNAYFYRLNIVQNYYVITGSCLVSKKSIFEKVGGLYLKNLSVTFNDVNFCLRFSIKGI